MGAGTNRFSSEEKHSAVQVKGEDNEIRMEKSVIGVGKQERFLVGGAVREQLLGIASRGFGRPKPNL